MLTDSHAHLTDSKFAGEVDAVLARAREAGVRTIVSIASDPEDGRAALDLARAHPGVFATVGLHPHAAGEWTKETPGVIRSLAEDPKVVAIGETGLDFYYDNAPREVQLECFRGQVAIARSLDLPVVVHARSADDEVAAVIRDEGWSRGILHCFSGGRELLDTALSSGWYISFAGMITFPRWELADLLRRVPLDRLLVETDSPYLAPVPQRGKRNEPAFVRQVAERAAELRGEDPAELFAATSANARAVYRLDAT